jgi:glyoxylase-like metal-dependent hydrolase (beta-lactamase superfamily II)
MKSTLPIVSFVAVASLLPWALPTSFALPEAFQKDNQVTSGKAYQFERIAEGVYYATATGSMVTGSNNVVIVGDREAMVVDTGTSPAAARAFVEDLKTITNKPVRYVVNTHFHYDHTDGNQVYAGKADIIAHEYVRYAIQNLNVL